MVWEILGMADTRPDSNLTPKQALFVRAYLISLNATQATHALVSLRERFGCIA
jgi:hypothetical protein